MKPLQLLTLLVICYALSFCGSSKKLNGSTFRLTEVSADDTYGYAENNAIQVGGKIENGARNEHYFLNALLGPNGEEVKYHRQGSCCYVKSKNALFGDAVPLDKYEVTYAGLEKPIILYINMYDSDVPMKAPKGFTFRK
jgi:hypothetical protein